MDPVSRLRASFPGLQFHDVRVVEDGWDSLVLDLDDEWIVRLPRRPEVAHWIEREIVLLPELAEVLPAQVPRFELVARNGLTGVGYRKIAGGPAVGEVDGRTGEDVGGFLAALHRFPLARARAAGVPHFDPPAWRAHFARLCAGLRGRVGPLLSGKERERANALFKRVERLEFVPSLVHADLGPDHVLCRDGRLVGVIDWSDASVGDPALDLAWCLNGTPPEFAEAAARRYGVDAALRERSLFYHQLGPWYEVIYGLDTGQDRFVQSGLEGVRRRLLA